jgi:AraC family transcriptional regulator, melibiose operon regulatory protein
LQSIHAKAEVLPLHGERATRPVSAPERRFYADNKAFGRLGIRWFRPQVMAAPHAHGHIEMNWLTDGAMDYDIDGRRIEIGSRRLVVFWAGISHQTTGLDRGRDEASRQCNVYLPLDVFLQMPKLGRLRETLMTGAVISLRPEIVAEPTLQRWYEDYRSGNPERVEILKAEVHANFRRATLLGWEELLPPWGDVGEARRASVVQVRYVVAMLRHILEHLGESLSAPDVARVVGLHPNYALNLFSSIMQVPLRQFVIRMRLVRARTLLFETELPITSVGFAAGFSSTAQFYEQFKRAYGVTPLRMRESYFNPEAEERRGVAA